MSDDFTKDAGIKAPDMRGDFERARDGAEKKLPTKPKLALELRPPAPMGMGVAAPPQVSPQLRGEQECKKLKGAMRMAREFRRAARDGVER